MPGCPYSMECEEFFRLFLSFIFIVYFFFLHENHPLEKKSLLFCCVYKLLLSQQLNSSLINCVLNDTIISLFVFHSNQTTITQFTHHTHLFTKCQLLIQPITHKNCRTVVANLNQNFILTTDLIIHFFICKFTGFVYLTL